MLKNLRAIRQERHMTQQQVANHLGITRQALSNYENGTREPEYDLLCRLAELLRCPVGRLLGFSGAYESAGARIPILGTVKGGFNRLADQEFEGSRPGTSPWSTARRPCRAGRSASCSWRTTRRRSSASSSPAGA